MSQQITRQQFLAGTVAAGAIALGATIQTAAMATPAQDEYMEDNVSPIPPVEPPAAWDYEVDVVVVGTGGAGGCAAVAAYEEGADVLVIERANVWGGNTQFATLWSGTQESTFDDLYASYRKTPMNRGIARMLATNLPDDQAWMQKHGEGYMVYQPEHPAVGWAPGTGWVPAPANFVEAEDAPFYEQAWYQWFPHNATGFTNTMLIAAEKYGIPTLYNTRVVNLVMQDGIVVGVKGVQEDGTVIYAKAGATVLATGGFNSNWDMLKHYLPEERYADTSIGEGTPFALGDGIRMAQGIGVRCTDLDKNEIWDGGVYDPNHSGSGVKYSAANQMNRWPSLSVNVWGKRFMGEKDGGAGVQEDIRRAEPHHIVFTILDSTMVDPVAAVEMFTLSSCEFPSPLFKRYFDEQLANGVIMCADTIEELAVLMEVDPETLVATVERYNELCDKGVDEDFFKDASLMHALKTPPFYATKSLGGESYCTDGGICYDEKLHAVDEYGNPVPGLFCAGETGRFLYSVPRALSSGRYAGRMAAREVLDGTQPAVCNVVPPAAELPVDGVVDTTNWWIARTTPDGNGEGCQGCHSVEGMHTQPENHEAFTGGECLSCHDYVAYGRETQNPSGAAVIPHTVPGVSTQIFE